MTKNVKIGLIAFGILGTGVGAFFLIKYLKLKKAYSTNLDASNASLLIQQQTQNVDDTIIPDDFTNNADAKKGSEELDPSLESTILDYNQNDALNQFNIQSGMGDY
jgi:hypothetical protein